MTQILFSYPSVPSNFKNLIVVPDVGFVSTPENPFEYIKGEKYLRQNYKRFNSYKPFIIGKHRCDKQKDITSEIDLIEEITPPISSVTTDFTLSRDFPRLTYLDKKRCTEIYKNYENFVNTNTDKLVATISHREVSRLFLTKKKFHKYCSKTKIVVEDANILLTGDCYRKEFSKNNPLWSYTVKSHAEMSRENFQILFNFPLTSVFWRDDYYLKIYSSGLLEFIPVKYNFSLYMKGKYSVLKKQKGNDEFL